MDHEILRSKAIINIKDSPFIHILQSYLLLINLRNL